MKSLLTIVVTSILSGPQSWPPLPPEQIDVLHEFYRATRGEQWKRNDSWGSAVSPCDWYGIVCDVTYAEDPSDGNEHRQQASIRTISLPENNLNGVIPPSFAKLSNLRSLNVEGNDLRGDIPEGVLTRWDDNELEFRGAGNSFSNMVVRVVVRNIASGVLCSLDEDLRFSLDIRESGEARFESIRCIAGTERETHCLVREGTAYIPGRFSRTLALLGYRSFEAEYDDVARPGWTTHGTYLTTTVWWADGSQSTVHTYNRQGPLNAWMAQQLFLSLLTEPYWVREYTLPECQGVK